MKAVKTLLTLVVAIAVAGGVIWYFGKQNASGGGSSAARSTGGAPQAQHKPAGKPEDKPRVEEKYGFTSEGVGN